MADEVLSPVRRCFAAFTARRAVVVVVGEGDDAAWGARVADLADHGRIALFVGSLPTDTEAATAMGAELFPDSEVELVDGSITE